MKISKKLLFPVLIVIMLQWCGAIYFYDFPQLFESQLINKFKISTIEISLLYSLSSIPNIFTNLLGAWLIEKIGLGLSSALFSTQVFLGIFICSLGIFNNNFKYLLVGRVFFGIGFGTTFLSQTLSTEQWFSGRFMTLAYGLNRSCVYLFQAVSTFLQPELLFNSRGFEFPMFVYGAIAFVCFLTTAIFAVIHMKKNHLLKDKKSEKAMKSKFGWKDFRHIEFISWITAMDIAMTSNCYYQVMNFTTDMIVKRYGMNYEEAKNATTIIPISSMIGIPIFGALFNKFGKKGIGLFMSGILALATFVSMSLIPYNSGKNYVYFALLMVSLFRSVYTGCAWSCLVISLPKQAATTFVALAATFQNLLLSTLPLVFGTFNYKRDYSAYQNSLYFLSGMAVVCTILSSIICFTDLKTDKMLHLPENDKRVVEMKLKKIEEFRRKKEERMKSKRIKKSLNKLKNERMSYKSMQSSALISGKDKASTANESLVG